MEHSPRIDFTPERWFSRHSSHRNGNLLFEIIPDFDYLSAFGNNSVSYLGAHNYIDKITGYEITWDGKHVCDRCGAPLDESGAAKSVRLAYALGKNEWMKKRIGLCTKCEEMMDTLQQNDSEHIKAYWKKSNRLMSNDWDRYAWL